MKDWILIEKSNKEHNFRTFARWINKNHIVEVEYWQEKSGEYTVCFTRSSEKTMHYRNLNSKQDVINIINKVIPGLIPETKEEISVENHTSRQ